VSATPRRKLEASLRLAQVTAKDAEIHTLQRLRERLEESLRLVTAREEERMRELKAEVDYV
jgi:hypothetical protein